MTTFLIIAGVVAAVYIFGAIGFVQEVPAMSGRQAAGGAGERSAAYIPEETKKIKSHRVRRAS